MKVFKLLALSAAALLTLYSCEKHEIPQPKPAPTPEKETDEPKEFSSEPAPCDNRVVAHRGGSMESGAPDNSRASLKYTMSLKCYAMECDIYWAKDNNVIIGHAENTYYINGLKPWEHTLQEIRKAGVLKNGETIPTLEDFLEIVQVDGNCTKLVLDIKNLDGTLTAYPIKAVQRSCEIIKEHKAEKFCEFICTGNETVAAAAANCMVVYGIPVGWMANKNPAGHKAKGFKWANLSAKSYMTPYGDGERTIDEFKNAGMQISVFNIDQKSGDGNAVFSDEAVNYYISRYADLRFICTNYPKWMLSKLNK